MTSESFKAATWTQEHRLRSFFVIPMGFLKWMSRNQSVISSSMNSSRAKGKGFKDRNMLKHLKAMFGFKPLKADRIMLVVSSEDMEPTQFASMSETMKAFSMGEKVIRYTRNNGRDFMRKIEGEAFGCFLSIKWCCT